MDIIKDFKWHSSTGVTADVVNNKKIVRKIKASDKRQMSKFMRTGKDLLIHRSTKALWKFSDDGETIIPVFEEDMLTEEDLK